MSSFQLTLAKYLDLDFQLNEIDYSPANFHHADLSPEEFAAALKRRGESMVTMILKLMVAGYASQLKNIEETHTSNVMLLLSLFSSNRSLIMKRAVANQLSSMEELFSSISGEQGNVLIGDRNDAALDELNRVIASGSKKIAIFYGAAHFPDFIEKLKKRGFVVKDSTWLTAWDLKSVIN